MPSRAVYLDHSATTATDPRVVEAMLPYFTQGFGNASSSHSAGRYAEQAIEDARERMALVLNCKTTEIIFTSGGSESNNLALRGAGWQHRTHSNKNHLITTPIEHSAIGRTVDQLSELMGFSSSVLPLTAHGVLDVEDFAAAIRPETSVASVMYANNEVGTIEPIPQLSAVARQHGVAFHTDAVQAAGQLSLDVQMLGIDMMSLSAHKFYGPKGVGALYVRDGIQLLPSQTGGSHERGLRAGTHNTPGIVGMAQALMLAHEEREARAAHLRTMRDALITGILSKVTGAQLTGHPTMRLPSHASFVFEGVEANMLLMHLDMKGVSASSASACKTGNPEPSEVLLALGYSRELALSSLRLTVGLHTSEDDVAYAIDAVSASVAKVRMFR
jgi:cysteine desulfurase